MPIEKYDANIKDEVRRSYVAKGPCQPRTHNFPKKKYGNQYRCFNPSWFDSFPLLEYSVEKDSVFCLWCYLFKPTTYGLQSGRDVFSKLGYNNWKNAISIFRDHEGNVTSIHNFAADKLELFKNPRQSVTQKFSQHSSEMEVAYRVRLMAVLDIMRFLLRQGLAFRGHDESSSSKNKGKFLELLYWYGARVDKIAKTLKANAPGNNQMTAPKIQKDLVHSCAEKVRSLIIEDIGNRIFSLMVDEARDISVKEQMVIVLRYVDSRGQVIERFLCVEHVTDTSSHTLKEAIDNLFEKYGLSLSRLRGQGYDGASNMRGEFNGLKSLILKDNPYARYVHCFAHQLQLVVVGLAKNIVNLVEASCKRKDALRQSQHENTVTRIEKGVISTGKGCNQETSLARPGDTCWGSHYYTILRLQMMWPAVMDVVGNVHDDGTNPDQQGVALGLIDRMERFEFVFILFLMKKVLGITNGLSQALQEKNQNIVNALDMVEGVKFKLQSLRDDGWDELLANVSKFCVENDIEMPNNMEERLLVRGRPRREKQGTTYLHYYRVEVFYSVLDMIMQDMNSHFLESTIELLSCISCLDPKQSFSRFDAVKLVRIAELYPEDFSELDRMALVDQLEMYIYDMGKNVDFSSLRSIGELAIKLVETEKHLRYPLVYRLIELALVLPVSTASVERVFSAMNINKTDLRNKMEEDFLTDCLVCYIEKYIFNKIDNEDILQYFQNMRTRRIQLAPLGHSSNKSGSSVGM
ncbi:P-loop containing nucleoside triphosphate hydrolase protein [Dioscorea alata]|uniref:P-loop containing nucleoside triphosphate hydrolase protein n=1 Tax=Dioscorea alata TaxID=55571 RepID=A0ACB7U5Z3_DIOAL|nr:P-loop containing nucleoside triphosphate hydrolase protein [Dioscorea alata]